MYHITHDFKQSKCYIKQFYPLKEHFMTNIDGTEFIYQEELRHRSIYLNTF